MKLLKAFFIANAMMLVALLVMTLIVFTKGVAMVLVGFGVAWFAAYKIFCEEK